MKEYRKLTAEVLQERARVLRQRTQSFDRFSEHFLRYPHLLFRCSAEAFVLDLGRVLEVLAEPDIVAIPGTPAALAGVLNMRGVIVDVVRLDALLGLPPMGPDESQRRAIICELGRESFGLLVEKVVGIVSVPPETIEAAPDTVRAGVRDYLDGVAVLGDAGQELASLLNTEKLLHAEAFAPFRAEAGPG